jgi:hypothetical protein
MSSLHRRNITLHVTDYQTYISAKIYLHDSVGGGRYVNLKELMLIPKTIREVERCLLLFEMGRAVLDVWSTAWTAADLYEALRLLTRLIGTGSIGKASVAHVLTMLGGPMERMESWGPPGRNKRRPCKVRVSLGTVGVVGADPVKTVLLGSVENWHATD